MDIKIIVPRNEVVLVDKGNPLYVEPLTEGEQLAEVGCYNDFVKPHHNGTEWEESATEEEIAIARPVPKKVISETDKLWDAVTYLLGVK